MEEKKQIIQVACPQCRQKLKLQKPQKEGTYKYTCPHCQKAFAVRMGGAPKEAGNRPVPGTASEKIVRKCSVCGANLCLPSTVKAGMHQVCCPKCKSRVTVTIEDKNAGNDGESITDPAKVRNLKLETGVLRQLRSMFLSDRRFSLREGDNLIGRADSDLPSDISVEGDATMSRRSAAITVERTEKGFLFKFRVLKATNPVYHNGKPLQEGESIYLNYGDTLVLGKTHFVFEKSK